MRSLRMIYPFTEIPSHMANCTENGNGMESFLQNSQFTSGDLYCIINPYEVIK